MKHPGPLVIGIDVGGTNLRLATVGQDGAIYDKLKMSTPTDRSSFISELAGSIALLSEKALESGARVFGAGIGMPGLISPSGEIFSSVNLPHCEGMNLEKEVQALAGLPVVAVNDANAAAFGEHLFGAGRSFRTFIMITIGTGIGGGIILDGKLWTGVDGFAGEFGHLTVVPDGRRCPCGNKGCVEQYSSATAIMALGRERGILCSSVENIAAMSAAGDKQAAALFNEAGVHLGTAAASVVNLLNPEAIIVGGGVAASFSLMHDSMRKEIDERSYRPSAERVKILTGELGDDAGVLGAAAVAFDRFELF
jgi:glucokinase